MNAPGATSVELADRQRSLRGAADAVPADIRAVQADLHCHSVHSDGVLSPTEVVRRAHANGVELHTLSDHDELGGLKEAAAEAARCGMAFVPGVEISVSWASETIHVVGLRINPDDQQLAASLERLRSGRDERAREMARQLERAGVPDAYQGALAYVSNPALISRTHFARHIAARGICRNTNEVFQRFLTEGKPGFVPHQWARLDEAVGWIRRSGGVAVLAHPGRYRLGSTAMWSLMTEFREAGGGAIEVVSGSHTPDLEQRFARHTVELGLLASRGSDFHAPAESRFDLGKLPRLPASVTPVWHDWPEALAAVEARARAHA